MVSTPKSFLARPVSYLVADHRNPQKHTFIFNIFYIIGLGATRMSVLLFLLRAIAWRPLKIAFNVAIAMTAVWTVAFVLAQVFICTPVALQWDLSLGGTCASRIGIYDALIYTNIVLDLGIMLLPSYVTLYSFAITDVQTEICSDTYLLVPRYEIWHLNFSRTEKAALVTTFILGFG